MTTTLLRLLAGLALCSAPALAGELAPDEIVRRSLDRLAFRSTGAEMKMTMTLRNKGGETRERTLYTRTRREGGLARTFVRFLAPSDVAGTSFLFLEQKGKDDDQFMYLPAFKTVRRIAGKQKDARFMGSDFTHADLEWRDLGEASYRASADEKVGKDLCHVIDAIPKATTSYSKVRSWVRKQDLVPLRLEFHDLSGARAKTLFVKEVKRVGSGPMVTKLKMTDQRSGHSTFIEISEIKLRDDLPAEGFTVRALTKS